MSGFSSESNAKTIVSSSKPVATVEYVNKGDAIQTMIDRLMTQLQKGESCLVVVPDQSMYQEIHSQVLTSPMAPLYLSCELESTVNNSQIQHIKSRIKSWRESAAFSPDTSEHMRALAGQLATKWFQMIYETGEDGHSAADFLTDFLQQTPDQGMFVLQAEIGHHPFTFQKDDFADWIAFVREAAYLYRPEFSQSGEQNYLKGLHIRHGFLDQIEDISHHLFLLKEQAAELRDKYYHYIHSLEIQFCQDYEARLDSLENNLETIKQLLGSTESGPLATPSAEFQPVLILWGKVEKELMALRITDRFATSQSGFPTYTSVDKCLEIVRAKRAEMSKMASLYVKSVNLLNQEDEELILLESEAHQFINYVNKTRLFTEIFELNTISLQKQAAYIRYVANTMDGILHTLYHNRALVAWQSFCEQLDVHQLRLLDIITSLDKDTWERAFTSWYRYCRIADTFNQGRAVSEKEWNLAEKEGLESVLSTVDHKLAVLWNDWVRKKPEITHFQRVLQEGNKGEFPHYWSEFLSQYADFLRVVFPVILIDSDQLHEWKSTAFDHLVYVDCHHANVEILQYFKTIYSWYAEGSLAAEPDFRLEEIKEASHRQIASLTRSEKLPFLRLVAEKMQGFGKNPVSFAIRNGCIISYCNQSVNEIMLASLRHLGIKKIASMNSADENLMGALLNSNGNIFIAVEDGLPNGAAAEMWEYQRKNLAWLKDCGCDIIHVCLKSSFRTHGKSTANLFVSKVEFLQENNITGSSQLSFAFE